jgi:hypothetical protein
VESPWNFEGCPYNILHPERPIRDDTNGRQHFGKFKEDERIYGELAPKV